jgi:hypothetical protein
VLGPDLIARQAADGAAETLRALAFLADRLALARRQLRQKIVKAAIALVLPVELFAGPGQKAHLFAQPGFGLGAKGDMRARKAVLLCDLRHRLQQRALHRRGLCDQPWPGHRRERHPALQFRIIAAADAGISLGPGVIKDIFALAVGFQVTGRDPRDPAIQPRHKMAGMPAGILSDRSRRLERGQKAVGGEWRRIGPAAIPFGGVDIGNRRQDRDREFAHGLQDRHPTALCQRPPVTSRCVPVT